MKYSDDEYRNETLRVLAACDWASGVKLAHDEVAIDVAKKALRSGLDTELIIEIPGLDEATISKLRTELLN
jgi:hypothetical protein